MHAFVKKLINCSPKCTEEGWLWSTVVLKLSLSPIPLCAKYAQPLSAPPSPHQAILNTSFTHGSPLSCDLLKLCLSSLTASALDGRGFCKSLMRSKRRKEQQKSILKSERAFYRKGQCQRPQYALHIPKGGLHSSQPRSNRAFLAAPKALLTV